MSVVDTIMLSVGLEEEAPEYHYVLLDKINAWLEGHQGISWWELRQLDQAPAEYWGGSKSPQARIWAGAFNLFGHRMFDFFEFLRALPWEEPDRVQMFLKREDEDRFGVYMLNAHRQWYTAISGGGSYDEPYEDD